MPSWTPPCLENYGPGRDPRYPDSHSAVGFPTLTSWNRWFYSVGHSRYLGSWGTLVQRSQLPSRSSHFLIGPHPRLATLSRDVGSNVGRSPFSYFRSDATAVVHPAHKDGVPRKSTVAEGLFESICTQKPLSYRATAHYSSGNAV